MWTFVLPWDNERTVPGSSACLLVHPVSWLAFQAGSKVNSKKHLLLVVHAPSANARELSDAVLRGASNSDIEGVEVRAKNPFESVPEDVLWADGVILGTPENFMTRTVGPRSYGSRWREIPTAQTFWFSMIRCDWDSYEIQLDQRLFIARHRWFPCCTDGLVLGTLEGSWRLFIEFPVEDKFFGPETIQGLRFWTVLSAGGSEIPLAMEKGRRVRLDPVRALAQKTVPRLRNSDKGRVKDLQLRQLTFDPPS